MEVCCVVSHGAYLSIQSSDLKAGSLPAGPSVTCLPGACRTWQVPLTRSGPIP